jgi:hypothetical protein
MDQLKALGNMTAESDKLLNLRERRAAQARERRQKAYDRALQSRNRSRKKDERDHDAHVQAKLRYEKDYNRRYEAAEMKRQRFIVNSRKREQAIIAKRNRAIAKLEKERYKKDMDRWNEQNERANSVLTSLTNNIVNNMGAVIQGQKSFGQAVRDMTVGFLTAKAIEWTAMSISAMGRYALSYWTDASALSAAKFYGVAAAVAGGAAITAGAATGGFGGGGGGGGGATGVSGASGGGGGGGGGSSIGITNRGEGGGGDIKNVTNINLYGRGGLIMTRKDLKASARRLQAGRVP